METDLTIGQPTEGGIQRRLQLVNRTRDGFIKTVRLIGNRNWLVTFQTRFHHTTLVPASVFFPILVAEVNLDTGKVFCQMAKHGGNGGFGLLNERLAPRDIIVGIDLDFHNFQFVIHGATSQPVHWCQRFISFLSREENAFVAEFFEKIRADEPVQHRAFDLGEIQFDTGFL